MITRAATVQMPAIGAKQMISASINEMRSPHSSNITHPPEKSALPSATVSESFGFADTVALRAKRCAC